MVTPTNVRAARVTALLAGFQSAKATAVTDFTASTAKALWTSDPDLDAGPGITVEEWANASSGPPTAGQYVDPDRPAGVLPIVGTPTALEMLLKSNWGAYSSPNFTLATQIASDRWMTLAWAESSVSGATQKLVRLRDAWFHRLELHAKGPQGGLMVDAHYAARLPLIQALDAGGVTLPAAPMRPSDKSQFGAQNIEIRRDPASANVNLRWRNFRLTIDQGLAHEWDPAAFLFDVWKTGKLKVELEFESDWSDETWTILTNARAETAQTFRVKATAEDGRILTVDLYNVLFKVEAPGKRGQEYSPFRARGRATLSGSDFVTLTLT